MLSVSRPPRPLSQSVSPNRPPLASPTPTVVEPLHLAPSAGQSVTYRCYSDARVIRCLVSAGERVKAGEAILMLRLSNGVDVTCDSISDCVVEEMFVANGQLVFVGTPLARVVRLVAMGVDISKGSGASIHDPFAEQLGRVSHTYARPKVWHCIFCGWRCENPHNDYMCYGCGTVRPFVSDEATCVICRECGQGSLGVARFCEWCGINLVPSRLFHLRVNWASER